MENLTSTGTRITIYSVPTFPNGITISTFAADVDPLDSPAMQFAETQMGVNGDLIVYKHPVPIEVTFSTVAGSEEDRALEILFDANRVAYEIESIVNCLPNSIKY